MEGGLKKEIQLDPHRDQLLFTLVSGKSSLFTQLLAQAQEDEKEIGGVGERGGLDESSSCTGVRAEEE